MTTERHYRGLSKTCWDAGTALQGHRWWK